MRVDPGRPPDERAVAPAVRLAAIPATVAVVLLGVWFTGGVLTDDFRFATALTGLWLVAAGALALRVSRRHRALRLPVGGTFLVTAALVGGVLGWTTLVDRTVDERVATGVAASAGQRSVRMDDSAPAARNVLLAKGTFSALAHETVGRAELVELAEGGRALTITGFETDPGPDLFVYLVAGDPEEAEDHASLGSLKGNKGDQQYAVPPDVDVETYDTVVIWCRAFSVAFGAATLEPA